MASSVKARNCCVARAKPWQASQGVLGRWTLFEPADQDAIDCLSDACIDVLNALKYGYGSGTYPTLRTTTPKTH
jgi:hypothetical protein